MKSILDPSFRYTSSCNTDLRITFARVRRGYREEADRALPATADTRAKVSSIVRRSDSAMMQRARRLGSS